MKRITVLLIALLVSCGAMAQSPTCFATPDGTDSNNWSFKDVILPSGFKVDSVFMDASRNGYPASACDFIFEFCANTSTYNSGTAVGFFSYNAVNTSLYNVWLRCDTVHPAYSSPGMCRFRLPTGAGAVWNQACIAMSPLSCVVPDINTGLVARYDFSGNANDLSGNNNNGIVTGATLVADRFGNASSAYSFNSITDSIHVPHSSTLQFSGNVISISLWVRYASFASSGDVNILISKQNGSGATQQGFNVFQGPNADGSTALLVSNGGGNFGGDATGAISVGQVSHVVAVYNNGSSTTYLNGVAVNTTTSTATIGANTMPLLIGMPDWVSPNAHPFNGTLDDIRIYNRALTQCDVDSLYNMPNQGTTGMTNVVQSIVTVHPNPATDVIYVNGRHTCDVEILGVSGKLVKSFVGISDRMDISDVEKGFYFLRIIEQGKPATMVKLIKQ